MQLIKVPGINGLGKTSGCRNAGNALLDELKEIYSNEEGKPIDAKLLDLEEIHVDNSNVEEQDELIYENALESLGSKDKVIFLGGDHSISFSIGRAFLDYCSNSDEGEEPCLIVFDSHPDCMPAMEEPSHEEWLRALVEKGFPAENILLVGVRNSDAKEIEFIKKNKIRIMGMNQLLMDLDDSCDIIMEFAKDKKLYLSLDIDVIDPAFAPATGYPEPGGLTSRQFIYLMQRIKKMKNLKAVDIVEINSEEDKKFNNQTTRVGAKILAEMI
ncbi:MAG: arginase family protein [Nanoarchaeota archaeon]|nr:arginase family protein [Nanoarchaeota archaeon]